MRIISAVCFIAPLLLGASASIEKNELPPEIDALCIVNPPVSCASESASADSHVFEGVEKRIEVRFAVAEHSKLGLREVTRATWDTVCDAAKCTIIHEEPDTCFDSYILSESSLFVFRDRVIIKTCGTTLPLNGVGAILSAGKSVGLFPLEMTYSRSSFVFPDLQLFPHNDLDIELKYLEEMELGPVVSSENSILGDLASTYWLVHTRMFKAPTDTRLVHPVMVDCIMTGLSHGVRLRYFKDMEKEDHHNEKDMSSSLQDIDESCRIVGKCYDPCGYSCNAHGASGRYFTVHITPEEAFSYASVETVFYEDQIAQIEGFVRRVTETFEPTKLVLTIMTPSDIFEEVMEFVPEALVGDYMSEIMGSRRLCGGLMTATSVMFTLRETPSVVNHPTLAV